MWMARVCTTRWGGGALNTSIGTRGLIMETRNESNDGKETGTIGNERKAPDDHGH